jgi:hypothetical protein
MNTKLNYVIAIPSYNRPEMLKEKTIAYLEKQRIPKQNIYIFLANKDEYLRYKSIFISYNLIIGKLGIFNQRNFISNYFNEGQYIIEMDDDVEDIKQKVSDDKKDNRMESIDLRDFIKTGYNKLRNYNLYLWGVNMISNPYFAYKKESTDLRLTISGFFGYINRKEMIQTKYPEDIGDDIVRTLQYYIHDGGVLRFNDIILSTKFYNKGGLQSVMTQERRKIELKKLIKKLVKNMPEFIREKPMKNPNDIGYQLIRNPKFR